MTAKLNPFAVAPQLMKSWMGTSMAITASLDPSLAELVKIRASQINGCANCINMHTTEARENGETEQRIYLLSGLARGALLQRSRTRRARLDDALTRLSEGQDRDSAYEALKAHFTEEEQVKLTLMINIINGWNRIAVGFGLHRRGSDPAPAPRRRPR